jgi:uncharacterized repeat protein (TIGR03803 family)
LYVFTGGADGGQPLSDLIFDAHGNLYGTTHDGGAFGDGTVFELTPGSIGGWSETVLHSFHKDGKDGAHPSSGLTFDKAGNLWGTTENGGTDNTGTPVIIGGTVFELSPGPNGTWSETVFSFQHANIHSGLIFDKAGNIYGTTMSDPRLYGGGTVFKLARSSNGTYGLTTLYAFRQTRIQFMANTPFIDGIMPLAGVIFDAEGNLYGTTSAEGAGTTSNSGTVFKLTRGPNGAWAETVLHNFNFNAGDAASPLTAMIFDNNGNLYGTAGGGAFRSGTVFELAPSPSGKWSENIIHAFNNGNGDGYAPHCHLILDAAGNLYGTSSGGGTFSNGTVFELSPDQSGSWSETVLHAFSSDRAEGDDPQAGVIFDAEGNLYGTTSRGGGGRNDPGYGVVFEILAGSGPAVSSSVHPAPSPTSSGSTNPASSSSAALQGTSSLADDWQSDSYAGQTFHFKFDGSAIYAYGSQQELLGTLQQKGKNGVIDMYEGLVQIPPLTQCPGGRGLMQIKTWNDDQLDAKIETPMSTSSGVTCGGLLGTGRMVRWQQVTFARK